MRNEQGFTVLELMVTIGIFAIVSTGFYTLVFSSTRSSESTRSIAEVSQEARLGFNRMVRDTREADSFVDYGSNSYTVRVDFDQDGTYSAPSPNPQGDYEVLTFSFDAGNQRVTLNGEVLMEGVTALPGRDVFSYSSNHLEYDWDGNGVTTESELRDITHGVSLTEVEIGSLISSVDYALVVARGNCADPSDTRCYESEFFTEAQLRNNR